MLNSGLVIWSWAGYLFLYRLQQRPSAHKSKFHALKQHILLLLGVQHVRCRRYRQFCGITVTKASQCRHGHDGFKPSVLWAKSAEDFFLSCSKAEQTRGSEKYRIPIILCTPLAYTDNKVYLQLQPAGINTPTSAATWGRNTPTSAAVRVKVGIQVKCNHRLDTAWANQRRVGVAGACFGVGMFSSSGCSCSWSLLYTDLVVELKWQGTGKWRREDKVCEAQMLRRVLIQTYGSILVSPASWKEEGEKVKGNKETLPDENELTPTALFVLDLRFKCGLIKR